MLVGLGPSHRWQNKALTMKTMLPIFILALLAGAGCETLPGHVGVTTAKLDGERQVHVDPGWLHAGGLKISTIKLGGFWSDRRPDEFVLEAVVLGVDNIEGLKIGIDGRVSEFKQAGGFTAYEYKPGYYEQFGSYAGHSESARRFVVPLDFVRAMVAGKKVIVRVSLSRGYLEGEFAFDQITFARPGFRKALAKLGPPS